MVNRATIEADPQRGNEMGYGLALRLREAAKAKDIFKPFDLARRAGLNPITVAAYMRGARKASLEACFALGQVLGVDPFWLHRADDEVAEPKKAPDVSRLEDQADSPEKDQISAAAQFKQRIPLYSCALAGAGGSIPFSPEITEYVVRPLTTISDLTYAVSVSGESMEPRYEAGETVYVDPKMPVKRGCYVVAQIRDGGDTMGYIKRFVGITDDELTLEQFNPQKLLKFARNHVISVHRIVFAG